MSSSRIVTCADCGHDRGHHGRGLCVSCYMRNHQAGTLSKYTPLPPEPRTAGECGTYAGYATHRRRGEDACRPCQAAAVAYAKRHRHDRLHARRRTVPAEPTVAHIRSLLAAGMTQRAIARQSGVSPGAISDALAGRRQRLTTSVAERILAVQNGYCLTPRHENDEAFVPKAPSVLRVRALLALGWRHQDMLARCGVLTSMILSQPSPSITVRNHDRVRTLYEALSMTPGPSQRTRNRAARAGFAPPLALDDDRIDDPTYLPGLEVDEQVEDKLDPVVVARIVEGADHRALGANRAERIAALKAIADRARRHADPFGGALPAGVESINDASRRLALHMSRDVRKKETA